MCTELTWFLLTRRRDHDRLSRGGQCTKDEYPWPQAASSHLDAALKMDGTSRRIEMGAGLQKTQRNRFPHYVYQRDIDYHPSSKTSFVPKFVFQRSKKMRCPRADAQWLFPLGLQGTTCKTKQGFSKSAYLNLILHSGAGKSLRDFA